MEFPNGAEILFISAESGEDSPRGTQCELLLGDEVAFYQNQGAIITQALLTCRLGMSKAYFFTTPKAVKLILEWVRRSKDPDQTYVNITTGSTFDNTSNLSKTFIDTTVQSYAGTRLERVELYGELILENEGALWNTNLIDQFKVGTDNLPQWTEVAIGVDPSLASNKAQGAKKRRTDACGIIVAARGSDGKIYTIEDKTGNMSVREWVTKTVRLFEKYSSMYPTKLIMESNSGGVELLSNSFDQVEPGFSQNITFQYSSDSKLKRAYPYALATERGEVRFLDNPEMEGLYTEMVSYDGTGASPNHLDAFVFAMNGIAPVKEHRTEVMELLM